MCGQGELRTPISSSCSKSVNIYLVATCHLQTFYNFKKLTASGWITSFDNQLAANLVRTCNGLVVDKLVDTKSCVDNDILSTKVLCPMPYILLPGKTCRRSISIEKIENVKIRSRLLS